PVAVDEPTQKCQSHECCKSTLGMPEPRGDHVYLIRKDISEKTERRHKNETCQRVNADKTPQRHLHSPGDEKRRGTQARDKAGEKDGGVSIACKEWPAARQLMGKPVCKAWRAAETSTHTAS